MGATPTRPLLWAAALACLVWAAVEARHLDRQGFANPAPVAQNESPRRVEESFAAIQAAAAEGRTEEAVLALRRRTETGPYRGYAWYLLGELASEQGAPREAVRHYRRAVELDPTVADRRAPFHAGAAMEARLTALMEGPWAEHRPPEVRDLYFLRRRLGGGCE